MYKRKVYDALLSWKRESKGARALLLEGARRTGKSTLARAFAENEYDSHLIIDFSVASEDIKDLFRMYRSDVDTFFMYLQAFTGVNLVLRDPSDRAHPITAHADGPYLKTTTLTSACLSRGRACPRGRWPRAVRPGPLRSWWQNCQNWTAVIPSAPTGR